MDFFISASKIQGLDPASISWTVIEPLWEAIDFSKPKSIFPILSEVSPGQRALLCVDWCQKEVRNGGFEQFFLNSAGMLANEALKGFKLIQAFSYAELLDRALTVFPEGKAPIGRSIRAKQIKSLSKCERENLFGPLEDRFYQLLRSEENDLERYCTMYVMTHRDEFFIKE
ncbi:MAG: DMP19 family protein [Armatimonadetes bacterium]|nr:DMP19 family protein [Armatimonadota bacterium]